MGICYQGVTDKKQNKTKQNKTKQNKTKQNKNKNNKTKESGVMFLSLFVAQVSTQT